MLYPKGTTIGRKHFRYTWSLICLSFGTEVCCVFVCACIKAIAKNTHSSSISFVYGKVIEQMVWYYWKCHSELTSVFTLIPPNCYHRGISRPVALQWQHKQLPHTHRTTGWRHIVGKVSCLCGEISYLTFSSVPQEHFMTTSSPIQTGCASNCPAFFTVCQVRPGSTLVLLGSGIWLWNCLVSYNG